MAVKVYDEPVWAEPQNIDTQCTTFQIAGALSTWIQGAIIRILQYHFSRSGNIMDPKLTCCLWNADDDESKIVIGSPGSLDVENAGKLPRIMVKDGGVSQNRVSFLDASIPSAVPSYIRGANRQRQEKGQVAIAVVAVGETNTLRLAEEAYLALTYWASLIKTDLRLSAFEVLERSQAQKVPEGTFQQSPTYAVRLNITWAFIRRWRLNQIAPTIKRIFLTSTIFEEI